MRTSLITAMCLGLMGCQQGWPLEQIRTIGSDNDPEASEEVMGHIEGIEAFAVDEVYKAHPTRALVDIVETKWGDEPGVYKVHVEMTGGIEFRDIFEVTVSESDDGTLDIEALEQVQGR